MSATDVAIPPPTEALPARDASAAPDALRLRAYGLVLLQVMLLTVLVWLFHLEEKRHLLACLALAGGGFAVHALLPLRWRRPLFVALSIAGVVLVLGARQATAGLAVGAALIGVAFLPLAFRWRVALVVLFAGGLIWLRNGSGEMFWPIIGSMFMFRMIIYLSAIRRQKQPPSLIETCSYFFLLPNAFFPLFPVVDYQTFRASYYDGDRWRIYQTGIHWMVTGAGHLVLYRLIKYELLPTPLEIRSVSGILLFLVTNYALYLRVSGQFHLVVGMLHLFGFHLPRTHDRYFLASSFSEIWRRINIYWKDFLQKHFFMPAFFRLRSGGNLLAVGLAVLWVFLWTWLGHSWQAFWLLGDFPLRTEDALMWLAVGVLVAGSAMLDYRRAASARSAKTDFSVSRAVVHVLKIIGVFACVSLFWARWTNPEVFRYLVYSGVRMPWTADDVLIVFGSLAGAILIGVAVQFARRRAGMGRRRPSGPASESADLERSVRLHLLALVAVLLLVQPPVRSLFGEKAARTIAGLQTERASAAEALALIDGYYEQLNDGSLQSGPFLGEQTATGPRTAVDFGDMIHRREDLLEHELIPNWQGTFAGKTHTFHRWGMRDRDRTLAKPEGTFRIALVGSSVVMGFGAGDDETFAHLLEERLNSESRSAGRRFEVLNFALGRFSPLHRRLQIERKVLAFDPDLILYFAHEDELYTSAGRIATAVYRGIDLEDPCLDQVVKEAGITEAMSEALVHVTLGKYHVEILECIYARIAKTCRTAGADLLYVYLPVPGSHDLPFEPRIALDFASQAGMETVDLKQWWGDRRPEEVLLGRIDYHPNSLGHRLIAERLLESLQDRSELLLRE